MFITERLTSYSSKPIFMTADAFISPNIVSKVKYELEPGEKIVWGASPDSVRLPLLAWIVFLLSFPLFLFSFPAVLVGFFRLDPVMLFIGIMLSGVSALMFSAPRNERRWRRNTGYFITDRKALVIKIGRTTQVSKYYPAQFGEIQCVIHNNGLGDIDFLRTTQPNQAFNFTFSDIRNPREAERFLRRLAVQREASSRPT